MRRRWYRPIGNRPSRSRRARRPAPWARRIRSMRPIRRLRPPTAGSWLAAPTRSIGCLMLEALGATELAADPRFVTGADRMAHLKELEAVLSARFRTMPRAHWLAALDEKGVPCGPVHDMLEALSDPQTLAREMVVEVEHSTLGPVKTIGLARQILGDAGQGAHRRAGLRRAHPRGAGASTGLTRSRSKRSNKKARSCRH